MYNIHAERSAGYAGIAFVVLAIIGAFVPGVLPPLSSSPTDLAAYVDAHRIMLVLGAWISFPAGAFFLWFIVGLRAYLRQTRGQDEGLPTYALVAGVVTVAVAIVSAIFQFVLGFEGSATLGRDGVVAMYAATSLSGTFVSAPLAIFVVACALSMRRHHSAPAWLVNLGYLTFAGSAVSSLCVFFSSGAMAPGGVVSLILGFLLFAIWIVATSLTLIMNAGKQAVTA